LNHVGASVPVSDTALHAHGEAVLANLGPRQFGSNRGLDLLILLSSCTLRRGRLRLNGCLCGCATASTVAIRIPRKTLNMHRFSSATGNSLALLFSWVMMGTPRATYQDVEVNVFSEFFSLLYFRVVRDPFCPT
jgi:hypothetical protein